MWPTSFPLCDAQTSPTHTAPLDIVPLDTALLDTVPLDTVPRRFTQYIRLSSDSSQAIKVSSGIYLLREVVPLELLGYKSVSLVDGRIAQDVERFCVKNKVEQK